MKVLKGLIALTAISLLFLNLNAGENYPYQRKVQFLKFGNNANAAGYVNKIASALADQLAQNKDFANIKDTPIAITSIVNIENLQKTDKFGNVIAENLIHEMQIRGFRVVDYKTMPNIKIGKDGDFVFSRIVSELKKRQKINYVLSGTYTKYRTGIAINCRIIDIKSNVVKSTAQIFVPIGLINAVNHIGDDFYGTTKIKYLKYVPKVKEHIVILKSMD